MGAKRYQASVGNRCRSSVVVRPGGSRRGAPGRVRVAGRVHVGCVHLRRPDRGRRRPRRSGSLDLGRLRRPTGRDRRRHRCQRRGRPPPTVGATTSPSSATSASPPTGSRWRGRGCKPRGGGRATKPVSTSTGRSSTPCSSPASNRSSPSTTGISRRRSRTRGLAGPGDGGGLRRLRGHRRGGPRRPGAAVVHRQRAVVRVDARLRRRASTPPVGRSRRRRWRPPTTSSSATASPRALRSGPRPRGGALAQPLSGGRGRRATGGPRRHPSHRRPRQPLVVRRRAPGRLPDRRRRRPGRRDRPRLRGRRRRSRHHRDADRRPRRELLPPPPRAPPRRLRRPSRSGRAHPTSTW